MGRDSVVFLFAVIADILFLRSSCERETVQPPRDPRTAHLGEFKDVFEPRSELDKYLLKWPKVPKPAEPAAGGEVNPEEEDDEDGQGKELSENEEKPPELNSGEILTKLGHIYDPLGGPMDVLLKAVKISDIESNKNSRHWVDKSHEAIKAAHHVIAEATNDAQTEYIKDGLRLDEAIRGNLKNETAKMYALSLDPSVYNRIHLEVNSRRGLTPREREAGTHDDRLQVPPPKDPDKLIGKRILCNNYYEGENPEIVRGHYGVIVAYDKSIGKYRIRLKHWMGKDFMPLLKHDEFQVIDGVELDDVDMPPDESKSKTSWKDMFPYPVGEDGEQEDPDHKPSPEWLAAMDSYGEQPVLVHHIPEHILKEDDGAKERYLNHQGTIIDYRHVDEHPEFRIKMDSEDGKLRTTVRDKQRPWLVLDRDFNFVLELKGKEIQVHMPETGTKGTQSFKTSVQDRGLVSDWHPEDGGYFDVHVSAHTEKVKPSEVEHLDGLAYLPPSATDAGKEGIKRMQKRHLATAARFSAGGMAVVKKTEEESPKEESPKAPEKKQEPAKTPQAPPIVFKKPISKEHEAARQKTMERVAKRKADKEAADQKTLSVSQASISKEQDAAHQKTMERVEKRKKDKKAAGTAGEANFWEGDE